MLGRANLSLSFAAAETWTTEKNEKLMREVDLDRNGKVSVGG